MKLRLALILAATISTSAIAQLAINTPTSPAPSGPPDKVKLSYAMGMNLGLQRKKSGSDADVETFLKGLSDVLSSKPTDVKDEDVPSVLSAERLHGIDPRQAAPDKKKYAYALGMRLASQIKRTGMELDPATISQALHDVIDGKPTMLQESEIAPLFQQAKAYETTRQTEKNSAEGRAFLEKNKQDKSVTVLRDGLQYKVITQGAGDIPKTNDFVQLSYVGHTVEGRELESRSHTTVNIQAPIKGFREALQKMKVGSKWELFIPSDLAYGHEGLLPLQIGPEATLIYELELNSIVPADKVAHQPGLGRMGHGLDTYVRPGAAGQGAVVSGANTNSPTVESQAERPSNGRSVDKPTTDKPAAN